jgi:short-subunit dehydrogenase
MNRNLNGRRVVLTGASSGIGRALAKELGRAGAKLVLAGRSAERLDQLSAALTASGAEALAVPTDLRKQEDRERLIRAAVERFGGIDVLVNSAGVSSWGHFSISDESVLREIMEVNFFAPAELIRLAIPHLANGIEPAIVNVASRSGRKGLPAWSEYSASKFALCGLTEALRGELARFDIDVILVIPGRTRSELHKRLLRCAGKAQIDFDNGMPPERVAAGIMAALRRSTTEKVIGFDARWTLRMHRWFPRLLDWGITRRVRKLYEQEARQTEAVS